MIIKKVFSLPVIQLEIELKDLHSTKHFYEKGEIVLVVDENDEDNLLHFFFPETGVNQSPYINLHTDFDHSLSLEQINNDGTVIIKYDIYNMNYKIKCRQDQWEQYNFISDYWAAGIPQADGHKEFASILDIYLAKGFISDFDINAQMEKLYYFNDLPMFMKYLLEECKSSGFVDINEYAAKKMCTTFNAFSYGSLEQRITDIELRLKKEIVDGKLIGFVDSEKHVYRHPSRVGQE